MIRALEKRWNEGHADKEDLVRLVRALTERGLAYKDPSFAAARHCLLAELDDMVAFRAVASFAEAYPESVSADELDRAVIEFEAFASAWDVGWNDPECYRQDAADFEFVGEKLGVDVSGLTTSLYQRADEIESERSEADSSDDDRGDWEAYSGVREDVDEMFQSLRAELDGL